MYGLFEFILTWCFLCLTNAIFCNSNTLYENKKLAIVEEVSNLCFEFTKSILV
jgi:hypothetical protein